MTISDQPTVSPRVEVIAIPGLPLIQPGDDLSAIIAATLDQAEIAITAHDVVVVTSKVVSRSERVRLVDLRDVTPSDRAELIAADVGKDPRVVELILAESTSISRQAPGVLIARHRLGFICANAGIDASNTAPGAGDSHVLLLPVNPDRSATVIRRGLAEHFGAAPAVIISDSFGRPFRMGTVGVAIGVAGITALNDQRGGGDLFGRQLTCTVTALADQLAAAADLVAGQAAEGRAVVIVRGIDFTGGHDGDHNHSASALVRPAHLDLYA